MGAFLQELMHAGVYKRTQGRITRQLTFAAVVVLIAAGTWRLSQTMISFDPMYRFGIPGVLLLTGAWMAYRIVNFPPFADFLIAVEAEMYKVSWPARSELVRASIVVLVVIFFLAAVLYAYDNIWRVLFRLLRVL